jgi:pyruvate dehydrogenase E2 component (dihydrolipoamide acetyltransferase)
MAVKVLMPKGSDTMTEGKVLKWLKKQGDPISTGDTLLEIETDKVDMEVEAMGGGVLRKVLVEAGKVVPVGALLAIIAKPEEDISALLKGDGAAAPGPSPTPAPAAHPAPIAATGPSPGAPPRFDRGAIPAPASAAQSTPQAPSPSDLRAPGRVPASPLARKMAREMGLDLAALTGSGPGGRIVRQDIERWASVRPLLAQSLPARLDSAHRPEAVEGQAGASSAVEGGGAPSPFHPPSPLPSMPRRPMPSPGGPRGMGAGPDFYDEPLSSMRKVIASRLMQSKAPVPHFYLTIEVDMRRAKELRESANLLDPELKLSYNDILLKACAAALRQHPEVNASFQGEAIRYFNRVHVGMAVAVEGGGLITPVIRDCDRKSLQEISREAKDLAARARIRKLKPDEYVGATFSVSNLGMLGIEEFAAVINPPEGAILAVGAVVEKPVVVEGRIEAGWRCRFTLSCDHRVVDGATGAKFLQTLKGILENPVYLAF